MDTDPSWRHHTEALGVFIKAQRRMADLSLREMATMTQVSNAYLSQIERGLHQPSVRVISAIAQALGLPPDTLLTEAGLLPHTHRAESTSASSRTAADDGPRNCHCSVESTIRADARLTAEQRAAMLGVYRSFTDGRE